MKTKFAALPLPLAIGNPFSDQPLSHTKILISSCILALLATSPAYSQTVHSLGSGNNCSEFTWNAVSRTATYGYDNGNSATGNRLPDFGGAGYRHGAPLPVQIPTISGVVTLTQSGNPSTDDRSQDIQDAIDSMAANPINPLTGYRGKVVLSAGTYLVRETIYINASGIVLSGSGAVTLHRPKITSVNSSISTQNLDDAQQADVIIVGDVLNDPNTAGGPRDFGQGSGNGFNGKVGGTYHPTASMDVGSTKFSLSSTDVANFAVGDRIVIENDTTSTWLAQVYKGGMDPAHYGKLDGNAVIQPMPDTEVWGEHSGNGTDNTRARYYREITAITGTQVTVDGPVFMRLVSGAQTNIYKSDLIPESRSTSWTNAYNNQIKRWGSYTALVENCGVENLTINIDHDSDPDALTHARCAITFYKAEDCWARNCTLNSPNTSGVQIGRESVQCTIEDCDSSPWGLNTGGRLYTYNTYEAQLSLFDRCTSHKGRHSFVNNGCGADNGVVFRDCIVDNPLDVCGPHMSWSTGILYENLTGTNVGPLTRFLNFTDDGSFGAGTNIIGHGLTSANCVAWHCDSKSASGTRSAFYIQKPPGGQNWAIGCRGTITKSYIARFDTLHDYYGNGTNENNFAFPETTSGIYANGCGYIEPCGIPSAIAAIATQNNAYTNLTPQSLYAAQNSVANNTFEAEGLAVVAGDTTAAYDSTYSDATIGFSGVNVASTAGQTVTFVIPQVAPGTYRVFVSTKLYNNKGSFQMATASSTTSTTFTNVGGVISNYNTNPISTVTEVEVGDYVCGSASPTDKKFRFTAGATAGGTGLILDYIRLQHLF